MAISTDTWSISIRTLYVAVDDGVVAVGPGLVAGVVGCGAAGEGEKEEPGGRGGEGIVVFGIIGVSASTRMASGAASASFT